MKELQLDSADLVHISMALEERAARLIRLGVFVPGHHMQDLQARWDLFLVENEMPDVVRLVVGESS